MKRWIALGLALALWGCGGLSTASSRYLRESQPFQKQLTQIQQDLKQIGALPLAQRADKLRQLQAQVKAEHQRLSQLKTTPQVAAVHQEMETLYTTMENFLAACLSGSGDLKDPKVKQLAQSWGEHLGKLQQELDKLSGPQ